MFLDSFYNEDKDYAWISPEQSSKFAKEICADFNPIHDPGAKRFCVPGDLLFALVLKKYGLSQKMRFNFLGMAKAKTKLHLPISESNFFAVKDQHGSVLMEVERSGETTRNSELIEAMIKCYVSFSGQNFPDILMPILKEHSIMFNPKRPLVVYDSMSFELRNLSLENLQLEMIAADLDNAGNRATQFVDFNFHSTNKHIGSGVKKVVIGGLVPYNEAQIQSFAQSYESRRNAYQVRG